MESNIEKIFERTDLQQIRHFLMTGSSPREDKDIRDYNMRLENDSENIINRFKHIYKESENDEFDGALNEFEEAAASYQNVFFEIGMKIGARLLYQLLYRDN